MIKIPSIVKRLFPSVVWNIPTKEKVIYFTFDDGPTPQVTDGVLSVLEEYNAKATFFCIGNCVQNHPEIYQRILQQGHLVGNHTYSHLKGRRTNNDNYFKDVEQANQLINSKLFRPPYGKMKWSQYRFLKQHYKIILWDVIPEDYLPFMTVEKLVNNVVNNVQSGSIIVLHDSEKCAQVLLGALPIILEKLSKQGYQFKAISV